MLAELELKGISITVLLFKDGTIVDSLSHSCTVPIGKLVILPSWPGTITWKSAVFLK